MHLNIYISFAKWWPFGPMVDELRGLTSVITLSLNDMSYKPKLVLWKNTNPYDSVSQ